MYKWNKKEIEKRYDEVYDLFFNSKSLDEAIYLIFNLVVYSKLKKVFSNTFEEEDDLKYDSSAFIDNNSDMDLNDEEAYHSYAVDSVSLFLKQFNEKYYDFFCDLVNKNRLYLTRNDKENYSTHYIDELKNEYFIYVNSNSLENEKIMLIREFGYAYQVHIDENKYSNTYKTFNSDKKFGEDSILLKDAFPTFLELSMLEFYDRKTKEEIEKTISEHIEEKFALSKEIDSGVNILYTKEERQQLPKHITSNYCALFMFSNNTIEPSFTRVDEFLNENHHGTTGSELWKIANGNIEGIDHYKEQILAKKREKENSERR
ncbi:MAG: hypothetical protein PHX40_00400 [Bacilli bacterium]|nr:hypothetical protein [Bacilli bacterium]